MEPVVKTQGGRRIDAQNPLSTDGDSIYVKDLDIGNSSIGDFSGNITDLFNDRSTTITTSVDNPSLTIALLRPINNQEITIVTSSGNFSNVKIIAKDASGAIIDTIDDSANSTKYTANTYFFTVTDKWCLIDVSFTTTDDVTLSFFSVYKSIHTQAHLHALKPDGTITSIDATAGGNLKFSLEEFDDSFNTTPLPVKQSLTRTVDSNNSTTTPLAGGNTFTGDWTSSIGFSTLVYHIFTDKDSATDGILIEMGTDGVNVTHVHKFQTAANTPSGSHNVVTLTGSWYRIVYTNGAVAQTSFNLSATLSTDSPAIHSHPVGFTFDDSHPVNLVRSVIAGKSELTGLFENINSFRGALKVDTALVHKVGINELFSQFTGVDTTLSIAASAGDTSITVVSAVGYIVEDQIEITDNGTSERFHFHIKNIAGSVLTLDRPLDLAHLIGTNIKGVKTDMVSVGSLASPQSFKIIPPAGEVWQITRVIINMTDATTMDDGLFGGMTALPNGVVIRANNNGVFSTGSIWKTNGDMAGDMYDIVYTTKAPAGANGLRGRWTFTKAEFVVELDGDTNDYAEILVQDDITPLLSYNIKAQGRLFGG